MTGRARYWVAGLMIAAAVVYLIASSTCASSAYYLTVAELAEMGSGAAGRALTVSGAVVGDSIRYDASVPRVEFALAHVPLDPGEIQAEGGAEAALHAAVSDPTAPRLQVVYAAVKPDMLRHEAQAVVRGRLDEAGRLVADQVLLKCPSRYQEPAPDAAADAVAP